MINFITKHIKLRLSSNQDYKNAIYIQYDFPGHLEIEGNSFRFKKLGLEGDLGQLLPIVNNYKKALELNKIGDFSISEGKLFYSIEDINIQIHTAEEVFILHEIWIEGCYNFKTNSNKLIVADIGMNVGLASLYFAKMHEVEQVLGFEPFGPTYQQALENLKLNEKLNSKVITFNYGLGENEKSLEVNYSSEHRGRTGVWGTDLVNEKVSNEQKERIQIKEFNSEFKKIVEKYPNHDFVLKIDCEGSEYGILENVDNHLLQNVRLIMMEWHKKGPEELERILIKNDFKVFSFNPKSSYVGMIYAIRQ